MLSESIEFPWSGKHSDGFSRDVEVFVQVSSREELGHEHPDTLGVVFNSAKLLQVAGEHQRRTGHEE